MLICFALQEQLVRLQMCNSCFQAHFSYIYVFLHHTQHT